jgi:hypothetical protein
MARSAFVFGNQGKPSLTKTICSRFPLYRKEPVRSWFKHIKEFPYGGWGFYARLHCRTYMFLAPVFNFHSLEFFENRLPIIFENASRKKISIGLEKILLDSARKNLKNFHNNDLHSSSQVTEKEFF